MQMMRAAEARANFAALLRRVSENRERIVIERRGKPRVAVVPVEDLERIESGGEHALRESGARLRAIMDHAPMEIYLKDAEGRYAQINRHYEKKWGINNEETQGKLPGDVHQENHAKVSRAHDLAVLESGEVIEREDDVQLDDGLHSLHMIKFPVRDAAGEIAGLGGIVVDFTDRKRVEVALRESEALLRQAAEMADLGHWVWDEVEDRCIYCSEMLAQMNGVTVEEYPARFDTMEALLKDVHPDDRARYEQVVRDAKRDAVPYDIEFRDAMPGGGFRYLRELGEPILDNEGKLVRAMGTIQDITEFKRIEEDLRQARDELEQRVAERTAALEEANQAVRESEKRLTQAQNLAKIGHTIWDEIEGRLAYHSETVDLIWGTRAEESFANFAEFLDTVHPDDRERVSLVMEQADRDRTGFEIDYRIVHPDGETRVIHEIAEPEFDKTGRLVRTVSTVQDITEQKCVEEELRESEERYRELFDESPVAIWEDDWSQMKQMLDDLARGGVKDWRGYFNSHRDQLRTAYDLAKIIEISRATIHLYRAESREQLARMTTAAVAIDEELDAFREIVLSFLAGQMTIDIEAKDIAGDGSEIMVRRRVVIPPKYRDDWSRVIFAIEDITERKRAEAAFRDREAWLRELQSQLHHNSRLNALGQLASALAHELNQPLTAVMNYVQVARRLMLRDGRPYPTKILSSMEKAIDQADRAGGIIRHLRGFIEQGESELLREDINQVVEEAAALEMADARDTGISVKLDLGADLPLLFMDKIQIQQVVVNLVRNSVHAMAGSKRRELTLTTLRRKNATVEVAIHDTGTGISKEVEKDLFKPFVTTKAEGMGIGLSISHAIIDAHGGHMATARNPDGGTTFSFSLPAAMPISEDHDHKTHDLHSG